LFVPWELPVPERATRVLFVACSDVGMAKAPVTAAAATKREVMATMMRRVSAVWVSWLVCGLTTQKDIP
jgi:hypothetical protein